MEKLKPVSGPILLESKDVLYSGIEGKIALLGRVWNFASGLGIPVTTGSVRKDDQLEKQETAHLEDILVGQDRELIEKEKFTRQLWLGVTRAIIKRGSIRSALRSLQQDPSLSWDDMLDDELASARGGISKVVLRPYSVNLVLSREAFLKVAEDDNMSPSDDTIGFARYISEFNVFNEAKIAEELQRYQADLNQETKEAENDLTHPRPLYTHVGKTMAEFEETIYDHEDFHPFAEFMGLADHTVSPVWCASKVLEELVAGEERRGSAIRNANNFVDYGHEELLAELVSVQLTRYEGAHSTFARLGIDKIELLESVVSSAKEATGVDFSNNPTIRRVISTLDPARMNNFIVEMYDQVRQNAPQRVRDLDMSFALFPPSQWRHIRGLVNRWKQGS